MLDEDVLTDAAVSRVKRWLARPKKQRDKSAQRLAALLQDRDGLQFAIDFVDRVIRPEDGRVSAKEFARLSGKAPRFLENHLRLGVRAGGIAARVAPAVVVPAAKAAMRQMVSHLVIDATEHKLTKHLRRLRETGVTLNVNLLGEAVLGRQEADHRLAGTETLLSRADVDYVSIKVSSVAPQLNMWAFDQTVEEVIERLIPLYRIAAEHGKFINLDMEEYRDLDLTLAVFMGVLSRPEFHQLHAGIVLQTYLPDALDAYRRLADFARRRVADGGARIKIRIVKGANLAMERVDAALHGWPLTTWNSKALSDANYKRVLRRALEPQNAAAVRIGVAGHNLFDLAYTIELANAHGTAEALDVEMLLGMAEEHLDAIRLDLPRVVLYTPVVKPADFNAAVAYLIRRLEENGSGENFMSGMFELSDPAVFAREEGRFRASLELMAADDAAGDPVANRRQDRLADVGRPQPENFCNEPDTDPSLAANRQWAAAIIERVPGCTLGAELVEHSAVNGVEPMLTAALAAQPAWADRGAEGRRDVLYAAADELARRRGELIEVMAHETGKTIVEGDVEVSEAIDFCRYYADSALSLEDIVGARPMPVGVTLVVPPWNFPCAIPCGGVVAALATGSSVVIKPAPQSARTAAVLVEALWAAGVPRDVLHFAPLGEGDQARALITDERVGRLIFTGSSETAGLFLSWRPELTLVGETSGKNGIIVTPDADLDLAANDLARSAFMHAGQKCSAASLGILVGSVGRSERFLRQLVDAVETLCVGYPDDARVHVGPIIEPAAGKLERALTTLEVGERWLLQPKRLDDTGRLWRPGIRVGVVPGSYTHRTEFFGPHLSLIAVETLDEAIAVQNGTDYGLTAGIHSLDADQVATWCERVEAGNLYVGRGITGAIVRRQPFGGWKLSQVGPGAKAGGPNYLATLVDWEAVEYPSDGAFLRAAQDDDLLVWESELGLSRDVSALGVERNVFRYRPTSEVLVRVADNARHVELQRVLSAAVRTGSRIRLSSNIPLDRPEEQFPAIVEYIVEDDREFHERLAQPRALEPRFDLDQVRRIRLVGSDPQLRRLLAGDPKVAVYDQPVTASGRLEMLPFLREQAVSVTAHRYGNPDPRFVNLTV
ncbi:proline dehydrogenase family protein [Tessaracoccus sp. OH4464_COT-324]|uniref:proline dehydrogenase family protein n=1 Tax=Tessaracoccus sp. OH4464_COT-324 TaxID=2491059 RepID=UPI000F633535|nr:proline dehydrogenase family protein [Tessaracoccus sp. OH4464_COT-324]RRD46433.1 aldehyde dehydrogenase family protein [Tessaracoccus sp. OH4464_COT-324]